MNLIKIFSRTFYVKRLYLNLVNNCFGEFYFDRWTHLKFLRSEDYTNLNF
jgi:hypothetical protein